MLGLVYSNSVATYLAKDLVLLCRLNAVQEKLLLFGQQMPVAIFSRLVQWIVARLVVKVNIVDASRCLGVRHVDVDSEAVC